MAETLGVTSMLPNTFQAKKKNNFLLRIEGVDAFIVKTSARPQLTTDEIEIPWMNSRRYIAGASKWSTLPVTLHDPIAPSGAQQVMEWIRLMYESVSGRAGYADFYKRDIQLVLTDPIGTVIELWDIKGTWITDINFGDLSYEDQALAEITLTLRFDNCVLQY